MTKTKYTEKEIDKRLSRFMGNAEPESIITFYEQFIREIELDEEFTDEDLEIKRHQIINHLSADWKREMVDCIKAVEIALGLKFHSATDTEFIFEACHE